MTDTRISSTGSSISASSLDRFQSAGEKLLHATFTPITASLQNLANFAVNASPVQVGAALREIDALSGGRAATGALLAGSGAVLSNPLNGAFNMRSAGMGRTLIDFPASPVPGTIIDGAGQSGFPMLPPSPPTGDGSGAHGILTPGRAENLTETAAHMMAKFAEDNGMDNAARHMRHFLDNSGETLTVDPSAMMRDLPMFGAEVDLKYQSDIVEVAEAKIAAEYEGKPMSFQITAPWRTETAPQASARDWYFALGTFSFTQTATVTVTPGENGKPDIQIDSQLHVFDRYNWDSGKAVDVWPLTINDEQLGQLHRTGLAQEFDVRGTLDLPQLRFSPP
jgi:hypothetical protein